MNKFRNLKRAQEFLREGRWDPQERWRIIQETITWAESQNSVRRNTPKACLKKQSKLLKAIANA